VITDFEPAFHLNLLAAEAVATDYVLKARIAVTTDTPLLAKACEYLQVDIRRGWVWHLVAEAQLAQLPCVCSHTTGADCIGHPGFCTVTAAG
jgi:hypothetical protein